MGLAKQWLMKIEEITNQILVFGEKGKLENPGKNSQNRVEKPQTQSTCMMGVRKSNLGLIGGRQVL